MSKKRLGAALLGIAAAASSGACDDTSTDARGEPPQQSEPEPEPESEPEGRIPFFVELLHLPTFPFLDSGAFTPSSAATGVSEFDFEFDAPVDAAVSVVFVPEPPDGTFVAFSQGGVFPVEDGELRTVDRGKEFRRYAIVSGDAGGNVVQELSAPGVLGELFFRAVSGDVLGASGTLDGAYGSAAFAVHRSSGALFETNEAPSAELERWVTEGDQAPYLDVVRRGTNFSSRVAAGLFVVHADGEPLFTPGELDRGEGLERLAEDGNPFPLVEALEGTLDGIEAFPEATKAYTDSSGHGETTSYSFVVFAKPGERLSLAGMLGQTNDTFVATGSKGLPLFRGEDPISGDRTGELTLWEVGTEVNERPGYGPHQAARQTEPNSGTTERHPVSDVAASFPSLELLVQLTINAPEP